MGKDCEFKPASDKAKKFIKDIITIDAQNIIGQFGYPITGPIIEYLERAHENGITAMSLTASFDPQPMKLMLNHISKTLGIIRDNPDKFMVVKNGNDIREAHRLGKLGITFNTQGSENLGGNPEMLNIEKSFGFTQHMMAYNLRYPVGDGCYMNDDIGGVGGLTLYGRDVIDACVRNKVILDLSHSSIPLAREASAYMKKNAPDTPFIYSHSNPKAMCDYVRNLTDEQIEDCAASGGTIGLCFFSIMFTPDGYGPIKMEQAVAAVNYLRDSVGIDHIHIASDDCHDNKILENWGAGNIDTGTGKTAMDLYPDGGWVYERCVEALKPEGNPTDVWEPAKTWPALADALWAEGYSDGDLEKIFGGNILRVYDAVLGE